MSQNSYKRQKVDSVFTKKVTTTLKPNHVTGTHSRTTYDTEVVKLTPSGVELTFGEVEGSFKIGDIISVTEINKNIIAIKNHTTNLEKNTVGLTNLKKDDIGGLLFLMAFPTLIGGGLFYKFFKSEGWSELTTIILVVTIIIDFLILRGVNNFGKNEKNNI